MFEITQNQRMKRFLIALGSLIILGAIFFFATTSGMDEIRNYTIPEIDMNRIGDGAYEGSCDISRWALTVKVTVKNYEIVNVEIVKKMMSNITEGLITEIHKNLIEQKSPRFDSVTGATMTSKAYLIAIADALYKGMKPL